MTGSTVKKCIGRSRFISSVTFWGLTFKCNHFRVGGQPAVTERGGQSEASSHAGWRPGNRSAALHAGPARAQRAPHPWAPRPAPAHVAKQRKPNAADSRGSRLYTRLRGRRKREAFPLFLNDFNTCKVNTCMQNAGNLRITSSMQPPSGQFAALKKEGKTPRRRLCTSFGPRAAGDRLSRAGWTVLIITVSLCCQTRSSAPTPPPPCLVPQERGGCQAQSSPQVLTGPSRGFPCLRDPCAG